MPITLPVLIEGRTAGIALVDRGVDLEIVDIGRMRSSLGTSRPLADTMPAVTVPPSPNGLPTEITQSPTWALLLSPN